MPTVSPLLRSLPSRSAGATALVAAALLAGSAGSVHAAPATPTDCGTVGKKEGVTFHRVAAYKPTKCNKAKTVIVYYLLKTKGNGKTITYEGYRCTTKKGGTVADGTAFRIDCKVKGKRRIRATYLGA